ncbi:rhomboid family intramembrane serine protease [Pedomonas mirosovicensis]|uniref:rhomboid family intramembrane serine protease n=1 Tax=Pedomonas mirosovicensis TaxID=2908641 RepID=UPI00216A04DF|nr:rhomboid family intramembrane serine protease [Pedomonas mirosovicensis]MCH8685494.1 rhomboid family intramembrane serine protease [Pedomonas mirosovicensis]
MPAAPVTRFLILACVIIELLLVLMPHRLSEGLMFMLSLIPARLTLMPGEGAVTLVTSQFLHAGLLHLFANMLFLWAIGRPVEWIIGGGRFVVLYIATGVIGGVAQTLAAPMSTVPVVGASGSISGMLAIYALMFSRSRVSSRVFAGFRVPGHLLRLLWFAIAWIGIQLMIALVFNTGGMGGVAVWAHIGGFLAGLVLAAPFIRRRPQQD